MDKPIEETKSISRRKGKTDSHVAKQHNTIKGKEDRYVAKHHQGSIGVTRKEFMAILAKAAQPIGHEAESDSGKSGT